MNIEEAKQRVRETDEMIAEYRRSMRRIIWGLKIGFAAVWLVFFWLIFKAVR